ncbi:hypothetical protein ACQ3I4_11575 [Zafaria sp. Z1313]|uniref:hypothetical protein n=1 Tax=Zafaria sp. Z1313 TaxID=3423202 RepID=UPI003D301C73
MTIQKGRNLYRPDPQPSASPLERGRELFKAAAGQAPAPPSSVQSGRDLYNNKKEN